MKIVVTGASGHFGRAATELLLERLPASDLILMTRKPESLAGLAARGAAVRYGDFDDSGSMEAAFEGSEKMLLISGLKVGYRIAQHGNAIEAAKRAGVRHIVYTSFMASDADNSALVCRDHHGTERLLEQSGLDFTILRDGMYADSMVEAAGPQALRSGAWISASGDGQLSFVDRDDCVRCAVEVLTGAGHEGKTYNLLGTELWSFRTVAALISELTGKAIDYRVVSDKGLYALFDSLGIPRDPFSEFNINGYAWCSDDMVSFERALREGRFAITSDDIRSLTGRAPRDFRDFVASRADELRAIADEAAAGA